MSHSTMVEPENTRAYVYNKKTFASKKEALAEEVNDRVLEIFKTNQSDYGQTYWQYINKDFLKNIDEISEVVGYYRDHSSEEQHSPNHSAGSDSWNWESR